MEKRDVLDPQEEARLAKIGQGLAKGLAEMFRMSGLAFDVSFRIGTPIEGRQRTFQELVFELTKRARTNNRPQDICAIAQKHLLLQKSAVPEFVVFRVILKG